MNPLEATQPLQPVFQHPSYAWVLWLIPVTLMALSFLSVWMGRGKR